MADRGQSTMGRFRLLERIGRGGHGEVWLARPTGAPRELVAIKRVRPGAGARERAAAAREASWLSALAGPGVIGLIETIPHEGTLAMVMELATGGSLARRLATDGHLGPARVAWLAEELARPLTSMHAKGLVHGDLRPSNILFRADGGLVLADFGTCHAVGPPDGAQPTHACHPDLDALARICRQALGPRPAEAAGGDQEASFDELARLLDGLLADPSRLVSAEGVARACAAAVGGDPSGGVDIWGGQASTPRLGRVATAQRPRRRSVDGRPTEPFARARPVPAAPALAARRAGPRALIAGVAGSLVLLAAVGLSLYGHRTADRLGSRRVPCPTASAMAPVPGVRGLADLTGTGCRQAVAWDGRTLIVAAPGAPSRLERYRLGSQGEPPGQLLFGNWSCRGRSQPAVYQRAAGEVRYYRRPGDPAPTRVKVAPHGRPVVVQDPHGCDLVVVVPVSPTGR